MQAAEVSALGSLTGRSARRFEIAQHRLRFDRRGLIVRRRFETDGGVPASGASGSYGRAYRYSLAGQIVTIRNLDQAGKALVEKSGVAEMRRIYAATGDLEAVEWRNKDGGLASNANKYAVLRSRQDQYGNAVQVAYFGVDGRPTLLKDGYARVRWIYDTRGRFVRFEYFDLDGKRVKRRRK